MSFLRNPKILKRAINLWPPFLGAGIVVKEITDDFRRIEVELVLRWYNRNYVGTHFGGSLCVMADPFFMIILINTLGKDYLVWDRASNIQFLRPGRGRVRAVFEIDEAQLADIRAKTAGGQKYLPEFEVEIIDEAGEVVARVKKQLYIRRK